MKSLALVLACAIAGAAPVQAGSITTLFATDNNGSDGGAIYFDIDVLDPLGITIEKVFLNSVNSGVIGTLEVYARAGTYAGFEASGVGWSLASSGTGSLLGPDAASEFDIIDFGLAQGVSGIALVSQSGSYNHAYTDGTGRNQAYANADLSLSLGSATNVAFSGTVFSPRVWNGTIEYTAGSATVIPLPPSIAILAGGLGVAGAFSAHARRKARQRGA